MEIGDRVVRITTEQKGYIHDLKPGRIVMVRVRWLGGMTAGEWLPSEEVRVWDKMPMPVQPPPRKRRKPVAPLEKVHWAGTSTCKKCGEGNLRWGDVKGKGRNGARRTKDAPRVEDPQLF